MLRTATLVAALTLSATVASAQAPASAPSAAKPAASGTIKTGTYDIELAIGGGVLAGTLELTPAGDSLKAKIGVGDHEPPPVRKITRKGASLTIEAGDASVAVVYDLTFDGDAMSGKFTFNGDPGLITGKRRK